MAQALPCVVLYGHPSATLAAASGIVRACASSDPFTKADGCPFEKSVREASDVALGPQHPGRSVAVDRRFSRCGALLIQATRYARAPRAAAAAAPDHPEPQEDVATNPHALGVLEVCKDAASSGRVGSTQSRRVIVVHRACGLPRHVQSALSKVVEGSYDSALFVITCASGRRSPLTDRSLAVPVPMQEPPPTEKRTHDATALLRKAATALLSARKPVGDRRHLAPGDDAGFADAISTLAAAEATVAAIRECGGDTDAAAKLAVRIVASLAKPPSRPRKAASKAGA
jgi:hypothetical protein